MGTKQQASGHDEKECATQWEQGTGGENEEGEEETRAVDTDSDDTAENQATEGNGDTEHDL